MRSTLSSLPYHGQTTKICEEKEMNEIKEMVPTSLKVSLKASYVAPTRPCPKTARPCVMGVLM